MGGVSHRAEPVARPRLEPREGRSRNGWTGTPTFAARPTVTPRTGANAANVGWRPRQEAKAPTGLILSDAPVNAQAPLAAAEGQQRAHKAARQVTVMRGPFIANCANCSGKKQSGSG